MTPDDILQGKLRGDAVTYPAPGNGRCIYCFKPPTASKGLSREHVMPLGLNGREILLSASCERCRDITSEFEGMVMSHHFGVFRARRDYATRHKKRRSSEVRKIEYITPTGEAKSAVIPITEHPELYLSPCLPIPGILTGDAPQSFHPATTAAEVYEPGDFDRAVRAIGEPVETFVTSHKFNWPAFARTLAKIAHATTVARIGVEGYEQFLPKLITGEDQHFAYFVGGDGHPLSNDMGFYARHHVSLHVVPVQASPPEPGLYIVAHIALVGAAKLPVYHVVVGRIREWELVVAAIKDRELRTQRET